MNDNPAGDPGDAAAAEYVIGTLPAAEREAFERAMAADRTLVALVRSWEERLAPLADAVPAVEPPTSLQASVMAAIGPSQAAGTAAQAEAGPGNVVAWPVSPELVRLRRSRSMWRGATVAAGSMAAALFVASDRLGPPAPGLLAVINRSGELPAMIVRVDPRAGTVQVRTLAAETPADHSLELWSIVDSGPPRSLGIVGAATRRASIAADDRARLDGATLAVSVEPRGGSTTGGPTGPVVYSGKLVPETP